MCRNKIEINVPTKYHFKTVEGVCGQTGPSGDPLFCPTCLKGGELERHQRREHDLKYNDY